MKMWGPTSWPMKGIVTPSAASRTSSATATAPVRRRVAGDAVADAPRAAAGGDGSSEGRVF